MSIVPWNFYSLQFSLSWLQDAWHIYVEVEFILQCGAVRNRYTKKGKACWSLNFAFGSPSSQAHQLYLLPHRLWYSRQQNLHQFNPHVLTEITLIQTKYLCINVWSTRSEAVCSLYKCLLINYLFKDSTDGSTSLESVGTRSFLPLLHLGAHPTSI